MSTLITDRSGNGVVNGALRRSKVSRLGTFNTTTVVVPSDTVDLLFAGQMLPAIGLYIGVAGNLSFIADGDTLLTVVTVAVPVGLFQVAVRRVLATGTTATSILAGR